MYKLTMTYGKQTRENEIYRLEKHSISSALASFAWFVNAAPDEIGYTLKQVEDPGVTEDEFSLQI